MSNANNKNSTLVDEARRRRFEESWAIGAPLALEECLPCEDTREYVSTLEELVHIQLEFAWKSHVQGADRPESVEALLERFPVLDHEEILIRILRQEFHCRALADDSPSVTDYQAAFGRLDLAQVAIPPGETVGPAASDDTAADRGDSSGTDDQATLPPPGQEGAASLAEDRTLAGPVPQVLPADEQTLAPLSRDPSSVHDDATLAGDIPGVSIDVDNSSDTFNTGKDGEPRPVDLGKQVPGYELLGELGRGGMGVVYRALDTRLKRVVALKMILSGVHADDEDLKRFQREAEAVAQLQHPNIVQIHDVGEHEGQPFFSLEFVEGGGLDEKIGGEPQPPMEAAAVVEQLARAVHFAHERNIVHRDLKPANVLLTSEGEPKITDFGLAKRLEDDSSQTASGSIMGTPSYMAPEQAGDELATIGPQTDVYALGALLYCLLTGRPPFQSSSVMDTVMQVLEQDPVSPGQLVEGLDRNLETITLKCLQKSPDRRYQSAEEVAEELRRHQAGEPIQARPIGQVERVWRWCRRKPLIATLWGSVAALVMFVTINGYYEAQEQARLANMAAQSEEGAKVEALEAKQAEQRAKEARAQIRKRAITLGLDEGSRLLDRNRPTDALARFANVFVLQSTDKEALQTELNRVRLGSVLRLCPRPTAVWPLTSGTVTFCELSRDGRLAVVAELSGRIRLFDTVTGKPFGEPFENDGYVVGLALSPEGDRAAACIAYEVNAVVVGSVVRIWDFKTRKKTRVRSIKHPALSDVLGFHPDGRRLLTCDKAGRDGQSNNAFLWDVETGEKIHTLKHTEGITWAGFFPDGKRLATVNFNDNCRLWNCDTGKQVGKTLKHSRQLLKLAAISRDGSRLATAGYKTARVWNAATLEPVNEELHHEGDILDIQFSHDGELLVTATRNWESLVWDAKTGKRRLSPLRHNGTVTQARFSPDDRFIVSGSADGTARVWSVANGRLEATLSHNKPVHYVAFHPDCRRVLTGAMDRGIIAKSGADARMWDLAITGSFAETELRHEGRVRALVLSPDGELMASGSSNHQVRVWSPQNGKAVTPWLDLGEPVAAVSFHADGKVIFAHGYGKTAAAWKVPSGELVGKKIQLVGDLEDAAMSPDGAIIATVSSDDQVQQWDPFSGDAIANPVSLDPGVKFGDVGFKELRVLFTPSGDELVGIFTRYPVVGAIRSWRTGSTTPGTLQADGLRQGVELKGRAENAIRLSGVPRTVTYSDDGSKCLVVSGRLVEVGNQKELQVIDLKSMSTLLESPIVIAEGVTHAVFSPDAKSFLTASRDNSARIWSSTTGQPISRPFGQDGNVEWVAYDAKGGLVVTCGISLNDRGVARVWDVSTGFPVTAELEHPSAVRRALLAPDGSRVFTACDDGRIRIWQLPRERRTVQQVVQTSSLLVGKSVDATGHEFFMTESDFQQGWKQLAESSGDLFTPTTKQIMAWHNTAISQMDLLGDGPKCLLHLNAMIAVDDQPVWRLRRAEVLSGMGKFDQATSDYGVVAKDENCPNHSLSRGGVSAQLAGRKKELEQFTSMLIGRIKDKKNPGAMMSAAFLLLVTPEKQPLNAELAGELLEKYVNASPGPTNLRLARLLAGLVQWRLGKSATAIQQLEEMLARFGKPESNAHPSEVVMCHLTLALAYTSKGDMKAAGMARQAATKLAGSHSYSYRYSVVWHMCEVLRRTLDAFPENNKS